MVTSDRRKHLKRKLKTKEKLLLGLCAGFGALAPDILLFWSKRFTMPGLTFEIWQYCAAALFYMGLSAFVALIYPYKNPTYWKAFSIGVLLPTVISGIASIGRPVTISPRGGFIPGTLLDLISLL